AHTSVRSAEEIARLHVARIRSVKDQKPSTAGDEQTISNRIYGYLGSVAPTSNLSVRSLDNSNRGRVTAGVERIDRDKLTSRIFVINTDEYFSVDRINRQLVHVGEFNVWALDDANRSLVSIGPTAEELDLLGLELRHHNLVFDRIVSELMDGPR